MKIIPPCGEDIDGAVRPVAFSRKKYEIYEMWQRKNSHQMPAFGVSLDDLTRQEMQTGVWLEFTFDKTCYNSDMPFDSLLINIQNDFTGFNIIRKYQNKYDGRCFYINLIDKNMTNLYNLLSSL